MLRAALGNSAVSTPPPQSMPAPSTQRMQQQKTQQTPPLQPTPLLPQSHPRQPTQPQQPPPAERAVDPTAAATALLANSNLSWQAKLTALQQAQHLWSEQQGSPNASGSLPRTLGSHSTVEETREAVGRGAETGAGIGPARPAGREAYLALAENEARERANIQAEMAAARAEAARAEEARVEKAQAEEARAEAARVKAARAEAAKAAERNFERRLEAKAAEDRQHVVLDVANIGHYNDESNAPVSWDWSKVVRYDLPKSDHESRRSLLAAAC